jgi:hypothetical protein
MRLGGRPYESPLSPVRAQERIRAPQRHAERTTEEEVLYSLVTAKFLHN